MTFFETVAFIQEISDLLQKIQILHFEKRGDEVAPLYAKLTPLGEKCLEANMTLCLVLERRITGADGQFFRVRHAALGHWPDKRERALHAHVTFVYEVVNAGHARLRPAGIDVEFKHVPEEMKEELFPAKKSPDGRPLPAPGDRVLSPEEMDRFLKEQGLTDIND